MALCLKLLNQTNLWGKSHSLFHQCQKTWDIHLQYYIQEPDFETWRQLFQPRKRHRVSTECTKSNPRRINQMTIEKSNLRRKNSIEESIGEEGKPILDGTTELLPVGAGETLVRFGLHRLLEHSFRLLVASAPPDPDHVCFPMSLFSDDIILPSLRISMAIAEDLGITRCHQRPWPSKNLRHPSPPTSPPLLLSPL